MISAGASAGPHHCSGDACSAVEALRPDSHRLQQEYTLVSSTPDPATTAAPKPPSAPLEVIIYQIAGDEMFNGKRIDGTGWDWSWAEWKRDWMDDTSSKFAYRCLPLTIANQTGWWIYNPVGFTATWTGHPGAGSVQILFDTGAETWSKWINDQFGNGIVTWNTPFLFRTRPAESRLLVMGPVNKFKHAIQPLTAIIESDWMQMSFTMNYKFTASRTPVRFDLGEPLFQVIPMATNVCSDLETAKVTYMRLAEDKEIHEAYQKWNVSRLEFHRKKASGEVKPDEWQKDYFQGRDILGRPVTSGHRSKVVPPKVNYKSPKP